MNIYLTRHAQEQMQEQEDDVTEEQIKAVLDNHHSIHHGSQPSTIRYLGSIGARELNVVAERPGIAREPVKIVTVYWEDEE